MSATLLITTTTLQDQILVEASVGPGADIPSAIFLYDNTGTDQLGEFFAVCSTSDYQRFQEWTGDPIPIFANKYVRYTVGRKYLPLTGSASAVRIAMVENCKKFRLEYLGLTVPVTQSYNL